MPEASEVKIIVDQLNKEFAGQNLNNVEIVGGRFIKSGIKGINTVNFPLHNVKFNCHGKLIFWKFCEDVIAFNHLGMAANFGMQNKHSSIKFSFEKSNVYFNDIRHFGNFKFTTRQELNDKISSLGWNIMETAPKDIFHKIRSSNNKTIAEILMNQSLFSGCGNYLKAESCYDAKINPLRLVSSSTDEEISTLCRSLHKIVHQAYAVGGATIATFKDMHGNSGKFFDQFKVYGRKLDPLNNKVTKIKTKDGRSTFYVEAIQK